MDNTGQVVSVIIMWVVPTMILLGIYDKLRDILNELRKKKED